MHYGQTTIPLLGYFWNHKSYHDINWIRSYGAAGEHSKEALSILFEVDQTFPGYVGIKVEIQTDEIMAVHGSQRQKDRQIAVEVQSEGF